MAVRIPVVPGCGKFVFGGIHSTAKSRLSPVAMVKAPSETVPFTVTTSSRPLLIWLGCVVRPSASMEVVPDTLP